MGTRVGVRLAAIQRVTMCYWASPSLTLRVTLKPPATAACTNVI